MQTCNDKTPGNGGQRAGGRGSLGTILVEAAVASLCAAAFAGFIAPRTLGIGTLSPHPIWLAVALLAARYGGRGLVVALPLAWAAVTLGGFATAHLGPAAVTARLSAGADLGAMAGVMLLTWVGSVHERRHARTADELGTLRARAAGDQTAIAELRRAAVVLRARADRLDCSLTFLRDAARHLDGEDPVAAAQAALELALARLGARGAVVELARGGSGSGELEAFASAGILAPVAADRTVAAAMRSGRAMRAVDLNDAGPGDTDLAAPILDERAGVVGVLAVRGVPAGGASVAALRDLETIAAWVAHPLARARRTLRDGAAAASAASAAGAAGDVRDAPPRSISRINA
jgi:hypothetical protein